MAGELPALGSRGTLLVHALDAAGPETELDLVVVLETDEPYGRRPDFFVSHLRPRVGTNFFVYTPEEYEDCAGRDPLILHALRHGLVIDEPA
jgi:hypothetical protein